MPVHVGFVHPGPSLREQTTGTMFTGHASHRMHEVIEDHGLDLHDFGHVFVSPMPLEGKLKVAVVRENIDRVKVLLELFDTLVFVGPDVVKHLCNKGGSVPGTLYKGLSFKSPEFGDTPLMMFPPPESFLVEGGQSRFFEEQQRKDIQTRARDAVEGFRKMTQK